MKAGLRVDIDCASDAEAVPALLAILKKYDARATFFIATGRDETYRSVSRYAGKKIFKLQLRRYWASLFHGFRKRNVESHRALDVLMDSGHEICLHGYRHYEWMKVLRTSHKTDISSMISTGAELFERKFGFAPRAFASPGFVTSDEYLEALDDFGFDYSSDFFGDRTFQPVVRGRTMKTRQVPVSMPSPGELGCDRERILGMIKALSGKYSVLYIHPSFEAVAGRTLLENILTITGATHTLSELL